MTNDEQSEYAFMRRFESLGENCEFGFVLQNSGVDEGSFFRWALVPSMAALLKTLDAEFDGHLQYENVVPLHETMILDRSSGIGWHSPIVSRPVPGSVQRNPADYEFVTTEDRRKNIIRSERDKLRYLHEKTMSHIKSDSRIFLYKPFNGVFQQEHALALSEKLAQLGSRQLLVVTKANDTQAGGEFFPLSETLAHAVVDRFAPGNRARDVSLQSWLGVCETASRYFREPV